MDMVTQENIATDKNLQNEQKVALREEIDLALRKICATHKRWLWWIFILCASPGVLNGIHISSYIFLVDNDPHCCRIPALEEAGWSMEEITNVSSPLLQSGFDKCHYYNYNYSSFAKLSFEEVSTKINQIRKKPELLPCKEHLYENTNTVISEWNLVCDRFYFRSNIQSVYALGKFFGASFFGLLADKCGRKSSFTLAAFSYAISAVLAVFPSSFGAFLFIRFLIGFGGMGCYTTTYTLLTEIIVGEAKTWICCAFNISYPVGMIILVCLAYYIHYWKTLLIVTLIPTLILPCLYWFIPESPQWLVSKNRFENAWKVVGRIDDTVKPSSSTPQIIYKFPKEEGKTITLKKLTQPFFEFNALFSTSALATRTLICFFIWFTVSVTYNGLTINGSNFALNQYIYSMFNGVTEVFSYLLPIITLAVLGRKLASLILLSLTGLLLISIMFLPKNLHVTIMILALFGRCFCTSAYVIFALHTSELYPTSIRNRAIGAFFAISHFGTFVSPYIVDILGAWLWYVPSSIFGFLSICSVFVLLFLPETKDRPMFNTIEEMYSSSDERNS